MLTCKMNQFLFFNWYFRLLGALGNTESELVQKKELLKQQEDKVKNLLQVLREILSSIHEFYIFDEDQVKVENQLHVNYI